MAADSTMFLTMNLFTALSFGTNAPLDSQKTLLTCVRGDEKISIESVLLAFIGYKTSRRSRTSALPKPVLIFSVSGFIFRARKNATRNASIHATDENDIRDRFCDKEVSVRRKTHVSSGPGGFVSPVSSTFLRHCFSFLFVCVCEEF